MGAISERYGTVLRCYDNGGKTADRYTVIPPRWAREHKSRGANTWAAIGANRWPFAPQGIGMTTLAVPGPHLGRRVRWSDLPDAVRRFARQTFPEYAPEA